MLGVCRLLLRYSQLEAVFPHGELNSPNDDAQWLWASFFLFFLFGGGALLDARKK